MSLPRWLSDSSEATRVTMMPAQIGDEQRRDLGDEAVADGQDRVRLSALGRRHAVMA
jgi:hypothetical protein